MIETDNQFRPAGLTEEQLRRLLDMPDPSPSSNGRRKRCFRRLPFRSLQVLVHVLNHDQENNVSFRVPTRNISAHGLSFLHKNKLNRDQRLQIEIPMLDGPILHTRARVARCRPVNGTLYEIGAEFLATPDEER